MSVKESPQITQEGDVLMGLNAYMEDIHRKPAMKKEEHTRLGREIQLIKRSLPFKGEKVDDDSLTSEEKERYKQYKKLVNKLVEGNLGLVPHFVQHYYMRGISSALDFEDLIQAGNLGLIKAAEYFDPELGYAFSTYAKFCIKSSVLTRFFEAGPAVKIPMEVQRRVAKRSEDESSEVENTRQLLAVSSLDEPRRMVEKGTVFTLSDIIPDKRDFGEEVTRHVAQKEISEKVLKFIPAREREIIELSFGLNGSQPRTLEELSKIYNVTPERVRQLRERGLGRLKSYWKTRELLEDYFKEG